MDILHIILDALRNSVLITGLVISMMMMIESFNIESHGQFFAGLKKSRVGQVVMSALLGSIPGCMGGFAAVSLYTHRMLSFGALVAMMIASSGDEAFMILAMLPDKALTLFVLLFVIAVVSGLLTDVAASFRKGKNKYLKDDVLEDGPGCETGYSIHEESTAHKGTSESSKKHFTLHRWILLSGTLVFMVVLALGLLEHEHHHEAASVHINLLNEEWMHIVFAVLGLVLVGVIFFASDHFVEEHLWHHIVKRHLPGIFAWTFGVLLSISLLMHFVDIENWISNNTVLMIILAVAVGIIPESGPHLIFVTLFASGIVPFPVLLASSISQDGHASIPLLAESKSGFVKAKLINCLVALVCGLAAMLFLNK